MLDTVRFFSLLFQEVPCIPDWSHITLVQVSDTGKRSIQHVPINPKNLAEISTGLDEKGGQAVYFGVGPREPGLDQYHSGKAGEIAGFSSLWLDLDIGLIGHASDKCPPDLESAMGLLDEVGLPEPSAIVWTGGGLQPYWFLDKFAEKEEGINACKTLQQRVIDAAAAHGWHCDNTAKVTQELRVPGTTNRKTDDHRHVACLHLTENRFNVRLFGPSGSLTPPVSQVAPNLSKPSLGEVRFPVGLNPTLAHVLSRLQKIKKEESRILVEGLLAGRPLKKGQRNNDLNRLAGVVSMLAPPGANAEDLIEIFWPTIDATIAEDTDPKNPAPTRDEALDKLRRSIVDAEKKRRQEGASREELLRGLQRAARRVTLPGDAEEIEIPDGPYTEEELRAFEKIHGSPLRWIVQFNGAHYFLVNGYYHGPIATSDLSVYLKLALSPSPLNFTIYNADGMPRRMKVQEILDEYSTVARNGIAADYTVKHGHYDEKEQVFFEAAAPLREITPKYNPYIDHWIRLLGGIHAHELNDWIACSTLLDSQCCALILTGEPGTGKTLLALGLSRQWGKRGYTSLSRIVGEWNTDLLRCPLIVADERLPAKWLERGNTSASAELREIIGSSSRTLTRKHLPNTNLVGAVRVFLISNDQNMIPFDEQMGTNDTKAVAGRFLCIKVSEEARDYLLSLGGRNGAIMKGWVDNDEIAAHALWLRENRIVIPGGRFIVEGFAGDTQRKLVSGTKIGSLVCEAIVGLLSATKPLGGGLPPVRPGNGHVLVSTSGIYENWENHIKSDRPATTQKIGKQLALMADRKVEYIRGFPYHVVKPEYLYDWMGEHQIGDTEAIKQKINHELPKLKVIDNEEKPDPDEI